MKLIKKTAGFLLCLLMVLSMSLTVFASKDDDETSEDYEVSEVTFDVSDTRILVNWTTGDGVCSYKVQIYDSSDFKPKNRVGSESTVGYNACQCDVTEKILKNGSGTYYAVVTCKKKPKGTSSYESATGRETIYSEDLELIRSNRKSDTGSTTSGSTTSGSSSPAGPGVSKTGWQKQSDGQWYYGCDDGSRAVGWKEISGKWYFFDNDGVMKASGWVKSTSEDNVWFYVGSDGAMLTNTTTPDGYAVDADGKWRS